jgi:hypothetical protein
MLLNCNFCYAPLVLIKYGAKIKCVMTGQKSIRSYRPAAYVNSLL